MVFGELMPSSVVIHEFLLPSDGGDGRGASLLAHGDNNMSREAGSGTRDVQLAEVRRERDAAQAKLDALERSLARVEFAPDGLILDVNANFLRTMGYERDAVVGSHHRMFVDDGYAASEEYRRFWSDLARGAFKSGECRQIGSDGRVIWIQATYNPVVEANGAVERIVKYATDITAEVNERLESQALIEAMLGQRCMTDGQVSPHHPMNCRYMYSGLT